MHTMRYVLFALFVALVSCGGIAERKGVKEGAVVEPEVVVVDYDSLFAAMDARYNALCEERSAAYAERDAEHRRALIEANDRACVEFKDSLDCFLQEYNRR